MNLRIVSSLFLSIIAVAAPCLAQTGTVTFYSITLSVKEQLKFTADQSVTNKASSIGFTGWLYDGNQKVAHAQRGRFMSFKISTGEHRFSVIIDEKTPLNKASALDLKVEDGGQYCIRLSTKFRSSFLTADQNAQIEQVLCKEAFDQARSYKPIDIGRVELAARSACENERTFPGTN